MPYVRIYARNMGLEYRQFESFPRKRYACKNAAWTLHKILQQAELLSDMAPLLYRRMPLVRMESLRIPSKQRILNLSGRSQPFLNLCPRPPANSMSVSHNPQTAYTASSLKAQPFLEIFELWPTKTWKFD